MCYYNDFFLKQTYSVYHISVIYLQSVMGKDLLSKGSAHFGSPSDLQTQHFILEPKGKKNILFVLIKGV